MILHHHCDLLTSNWIEFTKNKENHAMLFKYFLQNYRLYLFSHLEYYLRCRF